VTDAIAETGWRRSQALAQAHSLAEKHGLKQIGDLLLDAEVFNEIRRDAATQVDAFQQNNPLVAGIRKEALREKLATPDDVFAAVLDTLLAEKTLEVSGEFVHIAGRGVVLGSEESKSKETIEEAFASAGLRVPAVEEVLARVKLDKLRSRKIVTLLLRDRVLIKISDDLVFHRKALEQLRTQLVAHKAKSPEIDLATFKELAGISRKYAIPLLEYFDRERVTQRSGDRRIIL
jgi:selenocysteine-specific elongation factor